MTALFWTGGVLLALTALPAAFFFALHLGTGEPVPLVRARAFYHWAVVVFLGTFDIAIFTKVIQGIILIW
jgi:hypothetical protein